MKLEFVGIFLLLLSCCLSVTSAGSRNILCKEDEECVTSLCCYFDEVFAVEDTTFNFQASLHPHHIRKIKFVNSNFPEIPPGLFQYFSSLAELSLRSTGITKMNDYSFTGARRLITLDMSHNTIDKLVNMMFYGAFRLGFIDLSHNQIDTIEELAFHGLKGLNTLNLSYNKIKSLPERVFFTLGALYSLTLAHNNFDNPHSELFIDNIFLTKLDLSDNDLGSIDRKTFRYNKNIRQLNVSSNFLEDTNFLTEMDIIRLEDVDLSDNPLHSINFTFFGNMRYLRKLNMAKIGLTAIDFAELGRLKNLYELNLSSNNLGELTFNETVPFENLARLYVNYIGVQKINTESLKKAMPNLKFISIAGNQWRCNYLTELKNALKSIGVDFIDAGADCAPVNTRGPAQLVAAPVVSTECINEVALARIKVKETIGEKILEAETRIRDEIKRIINKRTIEMYNEILAYTNVTLGNIIT